MAFPDSQELMPKHNKGLYRILFPICCNVAIKAVREKSPEIDHMNFETSRHPAVLKQLMKSAKDREMKEAKSEEESEEEGENPE